MNYANDIVAQDEELCISSVVTGVKGRRGLKGMCVEISDFQLARLLDLRES